MGIIVDGVSEVLNLQPGEIEDTPELGSDVAGSYLLGMAKVKGAVKILLDIDQTMAGNELVDMQEALSSAS